MRCIVCVFQLALTWIQYYWEHAYTLTYIDIYTHTHGPLHKHSPSIHIHTPTNATSTHPRTCNVLYNTFTYTFFIHARKKRRAPWWIAGPPPTWWPWTPPIGWLRRKQLNRDRVPRRSGERPSPLQLLLRTPSTAAGSRWQQEANTE